ncbi:hypothetical protein TRVA0_001S07514 [Trichomonascus vanleenenianus]|uniref:uncharacterized protein n=1 Tax=Trichomonascus vanleenenianus TaxID=2268995 RepID=UPI003ECA8912
MLTRSAKRRTAEDAGEEANVKALADVAPRGTARTNPSVVEPERRPIKRQRIHPRTDDDKEVAHHVAVFDDDEEDEELSDDDIDEERPRFEFVRSDNVDADDSCEYKSAEESFMSDDYLLEDSELLLADEEHLGAGLSDFDQLFMKSVTNSPRWPIDKQDESTSFSLLNSKAQGETVPATTIPDIGVTKPFEEDLRQPQDVGPLLDDFVDYESAAESLTDSDGDSSSCSSPATPATPLAIEPVTRRDIPLYGYRHRNSTTQAALPADIKKSRFMAALSTLPGPIASENVKLRPSSIMNAYYQQALIAATGLNRRSLLSGKAKEMMGVGFLYN